MNPVARTVFLGSGEFAVPIVGAIARHPRAELVGVVTAPGRARGRGRPAGGSPVGRWAVEAGIPTLTPTRLRDPAAIAQAAALDPQLIVLADYGQIVPPELLALPPYGALNLHPSLLPRHRGASPIPATILAGDGETGVSLMLMDAGLDTGPIIAQLLLPLDGTETAPELEARLADLAASLVGDELGRWLDGDLVPTDQQPAGATLTRQLRREDGRLDPRREASQLARQVRAYQPWPGSFVESEAGRLIVWRARPAAGSGGDVEPGTVVGLAGGGLGLVTGDGVLELLEVQPQGGRRMTGAELLRGRQSWVGSLVHVAPGAESEQ